MSPGPHFDVKEQVRQAIDIVDLIGGYLQLQRAGSGYKALCPWHDDTRPSLQVNPERQSWKCWVCDLGGDIFSFIMKREGIDFREALDMLADRAGVLVETSSGQAGPGTSASDKQTLYKAMAWAERLYHECLLQSDQARCVRDYLADRGFTDKTLERFRVGFAPDDWSWTLNQARNTPWSPEVLNVVGLLGKFTKKQGYYDRFKGRIIFPIRDTQDRPIALGGRILPELADEKAAKYINSPETPLFSKSNQLYGLNIARDAIAKSGHVVVMEGYTDCLMAQQQGLENAVAVLGTALGPRHVRLLRRYAASIALVLDGDEAGQRRANEILELFISESVDLRILTLPQDLDPCDFLRLHGSEAFHKLIESAPDALEHNINIVTAGLNFDSDTHQVNQALEKMLQTLALAPRLNDNTTSAARLKEYQTLTRLAREFRVSEEELRKRLTSMRRTSRKQQGNASEGFRSVADGAKEKLSDPCERELLEIVIHHPEAISQAVEIDQFEFFGSELFKQIFAKCAEKFNSDQKPDFQQLLLEFDDPTMKNLLVVLDLESQAKSQAPWDLRLKGVLETIYKGLFENQGHHTTKRFQSKYLNETEETTEELSQFIQRESTKHRQGISDLTEE